MNAMNSKHWGLSRGDVVGGAKDAAGDKRYEFKAWWELLRLVASESSWDVGDVTGAAAG